MNPDPLLNRITELQNDLRAFDNANPLSAKLRALDLDIESWKRTADKKSRESTLLDQVFHAAQAIVLAMDTRGRILSFNPYMERLSGYTLEEVRGQDWFETFLPECDRDQIADLFRRTLGDVDVRGRVNPIVTKDGRELPIEWYGKTIRDADGKVIAVLSVGQEITNRWPSQQQLLHQNPTSFRAVFEQRHQLTAILSLDGLLLEANQRALLLVGVTPHEVMGRPFWETVWWSHSPEQQASLRQAVMDAAQGKLVGFEAEHPRPDGTMVKVDFSLRPANDERGRMMYLIAESIDITEQRATEDALHESEAALHRVQAMAHVGSVVGTAPFERSDIRWSEEMFHIAGRDPQLGAPCADEFTKTVHPDDHERVAREFAAAVANRRPFDSEFRVLTSDGTVRQVRSISELEFDAHGNLERFFGTVLDVTDRRRLEREYRQAQKLEAAGTLASGIAHDYNNLLMGILGCTDLALKSTDPKSPARGYLEETRRAIIRGASLTRQLLTFSQRREKAPTVIHLDAIFENSEKIIRSVLGESIELIVKLRGSSSRLRGDPGQIEQVLMNLVVNARDAMPDGGKLTLETAEVAVAQRAHLAAGDYITLTVTDTGTGMDEETRKHIFEPFFTTKDMDHGSGLGLATVYRIVQEMGGGIDVHSQTNVGTTFTLYFPKSALATDEPTEDETPTHRLGSETVLVVEDDSLVRLALRGYLEPLGYRVLEACDASEASMVLQRNTRTIDLLITDVMLPGSTGKEVAQQVQSLVPNTPVIFMSAHAVDVLREQGRIPSGVPALEKPFTEQDLMKELRRALGDGAGRANPDASGTARLRQTLLLVEDQDIARKATQELLSELDYDVVSAKSGAEALAICERHQGVIDAVLTDIGLPDVSAQKLVSQLRAKLPDVAVVYVSGRSQHDPLVEKLLRVPRTAYATKPVDINALATLVDRLLSRK